MRALYIGVLALCLSAAAPVTEARDRPGDFDYWVLALSWSPQFCKSNPAETECIEPHAFVVHGLWPQHERGYPDYCSNRTEQVPDDLEERMLEWMPSKELVRYQWRKHGTCSGMDMQTYFQTVERAYRRLVMPSDLRDPDDYIEFKISVATSGNFTIDYRLASANGSTGFEVWLGRLATAATPQDQAQILKEAAAREPRARFLELIGRQLRSAKPDDRLAALQALKEQSGEQVVDLYKQALDDSEVGIREIARRGVGGRERVLDRTVPLFAQ